jgi:hypothetical protein
MANTARVLDLAGKGSVPVFMTFEATKSGDHALPPSVAAALPATASQFIKTTFAATGQPQFAAALQGSGLHRFLVIGAETDVCVLQSVLGMRRAGYEVLAVQDALFTEEINTGPARRRMRQAGVSEVVMQDAEALLSGTGTAPAPPPPATASPVIVRPLEMGFFLTGLEGLNAADPNASAKLVRLRELLLISEWFKLPVLAADPARALQALPSNLRSVLTRPILALSQRPSNVTQLAVAGGQAGLAEALSGQSGDLFLLEDTIVGATAANLEPLYAQGLVPSTYKTLYYELTQSVDDQQWPSHQWVVDGDTYYDLTKAPEELPPLLIVP